MLHDSVKTRFSELAKRFFAPRQSGSIFGQFGAGAEMRVAPNSCFLGKQLSGKEDFGAARKKHFGRNRQFQVSLYFRGHQVLTKLQ